ncbi:MAG: hypothetical protein MHMPM18_003893, partial [Marteilia pararefringens]
SRTIEPKNEAGFIMVLRTKEGRSKSSLSSAMTVSAARSRNISIIAAINKYGMMKYRIFEISLKSEGFK